MSSAYSPAHEASEAPTQLAAGLISLTGAPHQSATMGTNSAVFSPSLDLLTQHLPLGTGQGQHQQQQSGQGSAGGLPFGALGGAGLRNSGPFGAPVSDGRKADPGEKQLCTFFLRTGTCAYGDRCKFKHPLDRPPPQLNSRGYPVRAEEPDCAHYLKKGWCAFGPTCKYNHPEIQPSILNSYSLSQPPTTYVSLPTTTFPSAAVYSTLPSAVPTLYYIPPGVSPSQLAGNAVSLLPSNVGSVATTQASQLPFSQQSTLAGAPPVYRQPAPAGPYGVMAGTISGGIASGMGTAALQDAFQGLNLGRAGNLGRIR